MWPLPARVPSCGPSAPATRRDRCGDGPLSGRAGPVAGASAVRRQDDVPCVGDPTVGRSRRWQCSSRQEHQPSGPQGQTQGARHDRQLPAQRPRPGHRRRRLRPPRPRHHRLAPAPTSARPPTTTSRPTSAPAPPPTSAPAPTSARPPTTTSPPTSAPAPPPTSAPAPTSARPSTTSVPPDGRTRAGDSDRPGGRPPGLSACRHWSRRPALTPRWTRPRGRRRCGAWSPPGRPHRRRARRGRPSRGAGRRGRPGSR